MGEVFTSPKLKGTEGILHVSQVYLNDLKYNDLQITFEDGKIKDYTCKNFDTEEENKKFIKQNVMFNHETLPIGEFAIGTNTTAYMVAKKYHVVYKLPILIVEKMGPHFAVGDTCYSFEEDIKTYNPDGKEIVARENEVSALRKTDIKKAYFGCHTDITTVSYTHLAYATGHLGKVQVGSKKYSLFDEDFATVNPYLGTDGIKPFIDVCKEENKGLFILVKTSNPSSGEFQDRLIDGRPLYEWVGEKVAKWGEEHMGNDYSYIGAVVGATYPEMGKALRKVMPKSYILVPGYGAQGLSLIHI